MKVFFWRFIMLSGTMGLIVAMWLGLEQTLSQGAAVAPVTPAADATEPLAMAAARTRPYSSTLSIARELNRTNQKTSYLVAFKSDGLTEYALLQVPAGLKPRPGWPVIILAHGYISPKAYRTDGGNYLEYMDAFSDRGYAVLRPDYRGHGLSGGKAEGAYYSPGYAADVANLISGIPTLPLLNPNQVGLFGHSMGGYVALRAAIIQPSVRATVVVAGAVGGARGLYHDWQPNSINAEPAAQALRREMIKLHGDYTQNPAFYRAVTPLESVEYLRGSLQIHHAAYDSQVPASFSRSLAEEMKRAGLIHEYYEYQSRDHSFNPPLRAQLLDRSIRFFDQHVKGLPALSGE